MSKVYRLPGAPEHRVGVTSCKECRHLRDERLCAANGFVRVIEIRKRDEFTSCPEFERKASRVGLLRWLWRLVW